MSILDDESIIKNTSCRELDNTLRQQWIMEHGTPVISPNVEQWLKDNECDVYFDKLVRLSDEMSVVPPPLKLSYTAEVPILQYFNKNSIIHEYYRPGIGCCIEPEIYHLEVTLSRAIISGMNDNSSEPMVRAAKTGLPILLSGVDFIPDYITFEPGTRIIFVDSNNDNINIPDCMLWFVHNNPRGKFECREIRN